MPQKSQLKDECPSKGASFSSKTEIEKDQRLQVLRIKRPKHTNATIIPEAY
jgi:hypothetical protein